MNGLPGQIEGEPEVFSGITDLGGLVLAGINIFILVNVALTLIFLAWAGMQYILSEGSEGQTAAAKRALTGAAIGLVLTILAISIGVGLGRFFNLADTSFILGKLIN